ncbi:hypothetical protein BKA70DRAFT_1527130 [Coprinopsis sp. MPI-PUGE-AT-0042]|nr:hypothetical protein BKA70DRAFT_1527130 [Coprinopsis sp. MPI-PUGE-AT-0042]
MNLTPPEILAAFWSYITSFLLLLSRNSAQAFYFKYYKAPETPVANEDHSKGGGLEFELKDFTHGVPRTLNITALEGVGKLHYWVGRREATAAGVQVRHHSAPSSGPDMQEIFCSNEGIHRDRRGYQRRPGAAGRDVTSSSPSG